MSKLIGLDIGSKAIKIVELEQSGKTNKLITVGASASPPKGLLSEASFDQMALSDAIKKTCLDAKVTTRRVNIALPESMVFTRVVEMPMLSDKELASAIRWEAEQYIPLPLTEAILDYQVMEKNVPTKTGASMDVFLVAAPKTLVAKYQKIIEAAELEIVSIETEALALARALIDPNPQSPVTMVVSMGAGRTNVFIAKGAYIMLTHIIPTGGDAITRSLATELGIDYQQAEEYKKTYGFKEEVLKSKVGNTIKLLLDNFLSELRRMASFYNEKNANMPIKRVVLVGGNAKLPDLVTHIAENLGIETQIGDPWQKVTGTVKLRSQPFDPLLFSEAVGLALKPETPV